MGRSKGKCLSENKEGLISLNNKLFCDVVRLLLAMNAYFVIIDQMDTAKSFFGGFHSELLSPKCLSSLTTDDCFSL
jgi:hypothetical protein